MKTKGNKSKKYVIGFLVYLVFVILVAIPTTSLTLSSSIQTATLLYQSLSKIIHTTSPGETYTNEAGIPVSDYGYKKVGYVGQQTNPLAVANWAVGDFYDYKSTGDEKYKRYFYNCIDWLDNSKVDTGRFYMWPIDYVSNIYVLSTPWYSALAQGCILKAYMKAYELSGDKKYLETTEKALQALDVPIARGGLMYPGDAGKWFAEIADPAERNHPLSLTVIWKYY